MSALVECRSDHNYAGRPVAVLWQGQRLEVHEVLASWREPGKLRFRVRCGVDRSFELIYYEPEDTWQAEEI